MSIMRPAITSCSIGMRHRLAARDRHVEARRATRDRRRGCRLLSGSSNQAMRSRSTDAAHQPRGAGEVEHAIGIDREVDLRGQRVEHRVHPLRIDIRMVPADLHLDVAEAHAHGFGRGGDRRIAVMSLLLARVLQRGVAGLRSYGTRRRAAWPGSCPRPCRGYPRARHPRPPRCAARGGEPAQKARGGERVGAEQHVPHLAQMA